MHKKILKQADELIRWRGNLHKKSINIIKNRKKRLHTGNKYVERYV
jgi:hypothetical protein